MQISHQQSEYCNITLFPMAELEEGCPVMMLPDAVVRLHDRQGDNVWYGLHIDAKGYQPNRDQIYPTIMRMLRDGIEEVGFSIKDKRSLEQCVRRVLDTVCVQRRCTINGKTSAIKYFAHMPMERNLRCCIHGNLEDDRSLERGGYLYSLDFLGHKLHAFVYHLSTDLTKRISKDKIATHVAWHLNNEFGHLFLKNETVILEHLATHERVYKADVALV